MKSDNVNYVASFSSGGAIQNEIVPEHLDRILSSMALLSYEKAECANAIMTMYGELRALYSLYSIVFPHNFRKDFLRYHKELEEEIEKWKNGPNKTKFPIHIKKYLFEYADIFFYGWNVSRSGIPYHSINKNQDKEVYDAIVGKTPTFGARENNEDSRVSETEGNGQEHQPPNAENTAPEPPS